MARRTGAWVVTDGRAGNEKPALALARRLEGFGWPRARALRIAMPPALAWLPARAWAALPPGPVLRMLSPAGERLALPWPALVIGAGRRAAPAVAAIRRLAGCRAVQILGPRMDLSAFDAVVAPLHDRLRGDNVVETLGVAAAPAPDAIARGAAAWRARLSHLPAPRAAVLIGGPSRSARWRGDDAERLVAALVRAAEGAGLMITPSRRTPRAWVARLRAALPEERAWIWEGSGENPYPGILGLADVAIVTADSVNMATEAALAGLPVRVFSPSGLAPKLRLFHAALEAAGAARPLDGGPLVFPASPVADDAAARVARLLGPPPG